jgi:hypothetical protein
LLVAELAVQATVAVAVAGLADCFTQLPFPFLRLVLTPSPSGILAPALVAHRLPEAMAAFLQS